MEISANLADFIDCKAARYSTKTNNSDANFLLLDQFKEKGMRNRLWTLINANETKSMTQRKIEVDMTSKAINARLRDVAQLRKLGLSIAKAKPIPPLGFNSTGSHSDARNPGSKQTRDRS